MKIAGLFEKLCVAALSICFFACLSPAQAYACGYPIFIDDITGKTDPGYNFSAPPKDFSMLENYCVRSNNPHVCNVHDFLFNSAAGSFLFDAQTRYCSDEDRSNLRWLYIRINLIFGGLIATLPIMVLLLIFWPFKKKAKTSTTSD